MALVIIILSQAEKGTKPFRLYNSWLEEESFSEIVREGLGKTTRGTGLFRLNYSLKETKTRIKQWATTCNKGPLRKAEARKKLDTSALALENSPNSYQLQTRNVELRKTLKTLLLGGG